MRECLRALLIAMLLVLMPLDTQAEEVAVFELRTYTTIAGRLPALQARFENHTMALFAEHGMQNIGYWVPADKPDTLVYLLRHASRAAADASWQAFVTDPQWQEVAAASTRDGPILIPDGIKREFMAATDYSPMQ